MVEWLNEWSTEWLTDCALPAWFAHEIVKFICYFICINFPGEIANTSLCAVQWRSDNGVETRGWRGGDSMTSTSVPSTHTQSLTEPLMVHLRLHRLHDITATRAKASAYTLYYCHVWQRGRNLYKAANWAHCMQPTHSLSLLPLSLSPLCCILNALRDIKFGAEKYATFFTFLNSIKIHIRGRL